MLSISPYANIFVDRQGRIFCYRETLEKNIMIKSQSLKAYCEKYHPEKAVRFSSKKYIDQGWMENIPLYAVCNL